MLETAPQQETNRKPEVQAKNPEQHKLLAERLERTAKQAEQEHAVALQEARTTLKKMEKSIDSSELSERFQAAEKSAQAPQARHINRELKSITLNRELRHVQRKLSIADRTLSKVVHQPVVRAVSEVAGKTVSRPSGLLGGGLLALIGTSGYLYLARHMGFTYNYFVFIALFAGGFALGLLLELVVHPFFKARIRATD